VKNMSALPSLENTSPCAVRSLWTIVRTTDWTTDYDGLKRSEALRLRQSVAVRKENFTGGVYGR